MVHAAPVDALTRRRRALAVAVFDGLLFAIMVGVTENYFGALAVELGHGPTNQALLSTVPVLAGAMSQLLAPTFSWLLGGRKRLVVVGAALQALTHLWLIDIASSETRALAPFLLAKILYFVGGSIIAPAWSAWMATLTEGGGRARYFALRSGAVQTSVLVGFLLASHLLESRHEHRALLDGYVTLFWVGLTVRCLSALMLASQYDPESTSFAARARKRLRIRHTLRHADFRVALYITMLMFGANIAVPFFVPYWLSELKLGYRQYAVLVGTSVLLKALTAPTLHRVSDRYGMDRLLYAAGLTVALLPASWAFMDTFAGYVVIQMVSGIAWGAIEYASFQLLLQSSDEDTRLEYLSIAGTLSGTGSVLGGLVGSMLIEQAGFSYVAVFLVSTVVRGAPLLVTASIARVVHKVGDSKDRSP